ncbi:alpha/beta hydrolase family protein [Stackebrandtia albiflava]|uniref:Alpha/beta hydrolase family protein n=1 Tax=Stackebrandtia albiflava TaxID=406432 RepID=A0A562VBY5_9ACTN|nr:alpha/beta hydrolase [Stackebrandtia albiflava]TWJ15394.1 alpha/beta hydrolase family protein [Stackebrandtia albiflava]
MNYLELLNLDTGNLTRSAEAAGLIGKRLGDQASELSGMADVPPAVWDGDDATAAVDTLRERVPPLEDVSQAMLYARVVLIDLAEQLQIAKDALIAAKSEAERTPPLSVDAQTGMVVIPPGLPKEQEDALRPFASRVSAQITMAVINANNADFHATQALEGMSRPGAQLPMSEPASMPGKDWTPQQITDWWNGLTEEERRHLLENEAPFVADTDGIPTVFRDLANRELLGDQIDQTRTEIAGLKEDKGDLLGGPGSQGDRRALDDQINAAEDKLAALEGLQNRINENGAAIYNDDGTYERSYLMDFNPEGDGQAVVAVGNPDTADNVVTMVPGMGSELSGVPGDLGRVERMVAAANTLDPTQETAGILWQGYDAPDGVHNAFSSSYAENGAPALGRFMSGLEAVQGGPDAARNTLLGHSYGSTVVGHAATAEGGVATDQMVFAGSPGVAADHASELGVGADNVYATSATNDIINAVPDYPWTHNASPVDQEFGAHVFDTPHDGGPISPFAAHSGYWDNETTLHSFAKIITGNGEHVPEVVHAPNNSPGLPWFLDPYN